MKYIRDLEAVGFQRNQAEAQVQMVLDVIEGDLATKAELFNLQERIDNRFSLSEQLTSQKLLELEYRIAPARSLSLF